MRMIKYSSLVAGHLDIIVAEYETEYAADETTVLSKARNEIMIDGDPEGLRSLANLLLKIADLDQKSIADLPVDAREHVHLRPNFGLSASSLPVIVGRLDAKGTGEFYPGYVPAKKGK